MPQEPALTREVEIPRPRSSGAAVVAVASLAMFTAVGASAFVVRVHMEQGVAWTARSGPATAWTQSDPADAADVRAAFIDALSRGDAELALDWYSYLPPKSPMALELAPLRNDLATSFQNEQYSRIAADLEAGDCEAVNDRLARLRQLLPESDAPLTMERCAPAQHPVGKHRMIKVPIRFASTRSR